MKKNSFNILIANYSIYSLALICWAKQNIKNNFNVLSIDTGFASADWNNYLKKVFSWLDDGDVKYFHLKSDHTFAESVVARKRFPSPQFSWCASFLKGMTLLNKIDMIDPNAEANILLSHHRNLSKASILLKDINEEEKYDYRRLNYPLLDKNLNEIKTLVKNLPFEAVFRSRECEPCIHFTKKEFESIATQDKQKIIQLEQQNQAFMFGNRSFNDLKSDFFTKNNIMLELSKACSWEYSCGL